MPTPYLGELKLAAFNFAPKGWALCNGQVLSIAQNQALFSLLGTQYGGDGRTTFALPNLQGAVPLGVGPAYAQGQRGGEQLVQLTLVQMPVHTHTPLAANAAGTQPTPRNGVWAQIPAATRCSRRRRTQPCPARRSERRAPEPGTTTCSPISC